MLTDQFKANEVTKLTQSGKVTRLKTIKIQPLYYA